MKVRGSPEAPKASSATPIRRGPTGLAVRKSTVPEATLSVPSPYTPGDAGVPSSTSALTAVGARTQLLAETSTLSAETVPDRIAPAYSPADCDRARMPAGP
jgi:hypothetical protein